MTASPVYLTDFLFAHAKNQPDKPFIIFENKTYTFKEVADSVKRVSSSITQIAGSDGQQIVSILLPNSPDFIYAYLGIVDAGHIAMPLDPMFKKTEVVNVVDQMKPLFTITSKNTLNLFSNKHDVREISTLLTNNASVAQKLRLDPKAQYVSMLFTSGTTGNPKATPYSHTNHLWNIKAVSGLWNWTEDDTLLVSLALSHWHGLAVALTGSLVHGNTMYVHERFDAQATLQTLETGDISLFMHVPIAYSKIIEHNPEKSYDLSKVRLCISGSSFLPPAMWLQFKERFNHEILERYGASEMGFLTSNYLDSRVPGSVGFKLDEVDIELQETGEIAMKSPGLFNGYWNNDEATKEHQLENGLWLSGDIGEFDDDGRLRLKGRVQEKMKKLGYTVYPRDVEWALMQNPKVVDTVVMSIQSDEKLSDDFVYFVVSSLSDDEIIAFAKETMPNYWRPDIIKHLEAIPRTGRAGKPALKELRAMVESP